MVLQSQVDQYLASGDGGVKYPHGVEVCVVSTTCVADYVYSGLRGGHITVGICSIWPAWIGVVLCLIIGGLALYVAVMSR